jgi:hypothetical protein
MVKLTLAVAAVAAFLAFQTPGDAPNPDATPGPFANMGQVLIVVVTILANVVSAIYTRKANTDQLKSDREATLAMRKADLDAAAQQRQWDLEDRREARLLLDQQTAQRAQEVKFELERTADKVKDRLAETERKIDDNTDLTQKALEAANHVKAFKEFMARMGAIRHTDVRMGGDEAKREDRPPNGVERRKRDLVGPDTSPENSGDTERK